MLGKIYRVQSCSFFCNLVLLMSSRRLALYRAVHPSPSFKGCQVLLPQRTEGKTHMLLLPVLLWAVEMLSVNPGVRLPLLLHPPYRVSRLSTRQRARVLHRWWLL